MRIFGTDIDGVIALIEKNMRQRIGTELKVWPDEKNPAFYLHDRYKEEVRAEVKKFVYSDACLGDPKFWMEAEPVEKNIEEMKKWVFNGWVPSVITGRKRTARLPTEMWLGANGVPYSNFMVDAKNKKAELLHHIDAAFMIEDRYEEALDIANAGFTSYLIRTPQNKHIELDQISDIIWVDDFTDITEYEKERYV